MPFYLIHAKPKAQRISQLEERLLADDFINLKPFGNVLTQSLKQARLDETGNAWWEEEDYCKPPLREEREAVLDAYFDDIQFEKVKEGEGWKAISTKPWLFPIFEEMQKGKG